MVEGHATALIYDKCAFLPPGRISAVEFLGDRINFFPE